ncbi:hypothetical protein ACFXI8_26965 [Streptomyces niveus]
MNEGESGVGLVGSLFLLRDLGLQFDNSDFDASDAPDGSEGFARALSH